MPEFKLIVDVDDETGFWYFAVTDEAGDTVHFRPGFRSKEEAIRIGDDWIRTTLQAAPPENN